MGYDMDYYVKKNRLKKIKKRARRNVWQKKTMSNAPGSTSYATRSTFFLRVDDISFAFFSKKIRANNSSFANPNFSHLRVAEKLGYGVFGFKILYFNLFWDKNS